MVAAVTFFPVGTGDMSLIKLGDSSGTTLLVDINIRSAADDDGDETPDVAKALRERLKSDEKGRPYVDAFLLTHPDKDHCSGLMKHFYLGDMEDYPVDFDADEEMPIVIREMWSSPIVFRRADRKKGFTLCEDGSAWSKEARRRVKVNRAKKFKNIAEGDRILILGEDENGKTDDLSEILVRVGEKLNRINGKSTAFLSAQLLAPLPKGDDEEEETLSKNDSSVVMNLKIAASSSEQDGAKLVIGGDAGVAIWEKIWERYKDDTSVLEYDMLLAPHHCSWRVLSHDSWSEKRNKGEVSKSARNALSETRDGAFIISSSDPIKDDDNDPPCIGAKWEYIEILGKDEDHFYCTGEYPEVDNLEPLEFTITADGPQPPGKKNRGKREARIIVASRTPKEHG